MAKSSWRGDRHDNRIAVFLLRVTLSLRYHRQSSDASPTRAGRVTMPVDCPHANAIHGTLAVRPAVRTGRGLRFHKRDKIDAVIPGRREIGIPKKFGQDRSLRRRIGQGYRRQPEERVSWDVWLATAFGDSAADLRDVGPTCLRPRGRPLTAQGNRVCQRQRRFVEECRTPSRRGNRSSAAKIA